ncbi:FxLYD domain-containing protein [Tepidiforma sp.]|uniref:FxLYD domain-containing protein n=1 Tax=Tepidiforma sp. TaxID=2682230 RepID=UPI002613BB4A|nr:FxLYD domain-containing protein [Tepidiforma sp.]MCX7617054.1 DUF3426 domain-containing protein [Tepidiforma sp.]
MPRPRYLLALAGLLLAGFAAALVSAPRDAGSQVFTPRAVVPMVARDEGAPPPPPPATPTPFAPNATPTAAQPTPTPRPPTATPTPAPSGLRLQGVNWYIDEDIDFLYVLGIVVNGLSTPVEFVEVSARFYSASGQLLATDWSFADVTIIPAGGSSSFGLILIDPPAGITRVEVDITDYDISRRTPITGLQVTVTNIYRDSLGWLHVVGTVRNTSSTSYRFVSLYAAFVDPLGRVIRRDVDVSTPSDLAPGQAGTFQMLLIDAPPGLENLNLLIWTDAIR